ncbi:MAG: hypothetical protein EOO24_23340, partial [Comamonadaceae bacterium]
MRSGAMTLGLSSRLRIAGPMLAWAALQAASLASAQPARQAAVDLSVPRPRLESGPQAPQGIEPVSPFTPRIELRPQPDAPALGAPAPAAAGADAPPPADARNADVERELQKLMRTAYAGGAYGATAASAQAAWLLGLIHLHGAGVRVDPAQAEQWFARAARQGREPWAWAGLAWCAIDSCAGPADLTSAERAIDRLRPSQPARADFLVWLLASQQKPLRAEQPFATQAQAPSAAQPQLLARAAAAGDVHANIELGIEAFGEQRWDAAEKYFRRAAPRSPAASANLREVAQRVSAAAHTGTNARNDGPADAARVGAGVGGCADPLRHFAQVGTGGW